MECNHIKYIEPLLTNQIYYEDGTVVREEDYISCDYCPKCGAYVGKPTEEKGGE